jgi:Ca-activated chloride channel family protein
VVAELATCAVVLVAVAAELLHARRTRQVAALAFGPGRRPAPWVPLAPLLRVAALGALCWGLVSLLLIEPKVHKVGEIREGDLRHLLIVLDVSPSMRLEDAGPTGKEPRMHRAAALLKSFFERAPIELYRISVVATYTEAKPVVVDTRDFEVIRNILSDLPMHHAFPSGATNLFAGLEEAARTARPWQPGSTLVMIVSDGDTVPATGMPKMPISVSHVLVVGVGDPVVGKFIEGHQSRQDVPTLRQIANRLDGAYHNGNEKHVPTDLVKRATFVVGRGVFERLSRREYALIACAIGAALLALLPLALHYAGTFWRPGTNRRL